MKLLHLLLTLLSVLIKAVIFVAAIPILGVMVCVLKLLELLSISPPEFPRAGWIHNIVRRRRIPQFSGIDPPTEEKWDERWKHRSAVDCADSVLPLLWARIAAGQLHRILFVGNGISLEPYLFSVAGPEVHTIDISPASAKTLKGLADPAQLTLALENFFVFDPALEKIFQDKLAKLSTLPEINISVGDFTHECGSPIQFDLIIARRVLQYFDKDEELVVKVCRSLLSRLSTNGILIADFVNAPGARDAYEIALEELGCHNASERMLKDVTAHLPDGNSFHIIHQTG